MTRIPLVDLTDNPLAPGGIQPNVYRAIANHPGALEAFSTFGRVVYFDSHLTPAQRELAYLTASVTNDCHY